MPHGPLNKRTAYGICKRHIKASYSKRHDQESYRDAYDPDKDG